MFTTVPLFKFFAGDNTAHLTLGAVPQGEYATFRPAITIAGMASIFRLRFVRKWTIEAPFQKS